MAPIKRSLVALTLTTGMLISLIACTPKDLAQDSCLGGSRPIVDVLPTHENPYPSSGLLLPDGTAIDARGESFDNTAVDALNRSNAVKFHFVAGSRDNLCFVGGTIGTTIEPENTPWADFHSVYGMQVLTPNIEIVGTSFFDEGDMIAFQATATNWKVIGVRTVAGGPAGHGYIHDDCIENDFMHNGLVDDVNLDGCTAFLSAISGGGTPVDGSANTMEVRNSLVYLRPYHNSYNTTKYGFDRHGGFFKFASVPETEGVAPHLYVHDSTFRADSPGAFSGNANGFLGLPPGSTCHDVTLINTDTWPASDLVSWQAQCTDITYGTATEWDAQVAQWNADHPTD